jgi:2-methylcitrate dehydratase PrpD
LAKFVTEFEYDNIPPLVLAKAKACVLDILGVCLGGSQMPWGRGVVNLARRLHAVEESTIIAYGDRTAMEYAALANGTFGHGIESDEQHNPSITHPSCALVPAALAVGEKEHVDGRKLLTSLLIGYELMTRIGTAVAPSLFRDRGFHPTATLGVFGSAGITSKILGFDVETTMNALSIAAMQACGVGECFIRGGEYKRVYGGKAAHGGIMAALLAQNGITGPRTIFEGQKGFFKAFSDKWSPGPLEGLGRNFEIMKIAFKPYASCRLIHSSIDAVRTLRDKHKFASEDIAEIKVGASRVVIDLDNYNPKDMISAQMSLPFSLALTMLKGSNDVGQYSQENIRNKSLLDFARKVKLTIDKELEKEYPKIIGAVVSMRMRNGKVLQEKVRYPKGEPENPMTQEELEGKFRSLGSKVLPKENLDKLIETVRTLEQLKDIHELTTLLHRPYPQSRLAS